ncbi:MAG: hypothetical protein MUO52_08525 [Desulfobacterales bacterium]|nr:hypothetical protein [Desulfobacterales bacterium]
MKKLSARGQRWLKGFHVFFSCLWVGAAVSLSLKQFFVNPSDGLELYGITSTLKFIDDFIIIPGAIGSLLTALIYSIWTNWGWFKHRWVTVKWAINLYGVIFGTFWLGPWLNGLVPIAKAEGLNALSNPTFLHNMTMLYWFGTFQVATLIFAVFISVLKPWKTKKGST